jgi:hypothetical protein
VSDTSGSQPIDTTSSDTGEAVAEGGSDGEELVI